MSFLRSLPILALGLLAACYSPSIPNGAQQCGTNGACAKGYECGPDNHCYKMGQAPKAVPDMAVGDLAMSCTAATCKNTPKPFCDVTGLCVECLTDANCASGKVCTGKACVPGCNSMHGCPDGGGACDPMSKMCARCMADKDCGGGTPRCDTNSGECVECLPMNDNCAPGKYCGAVNGVYVCQTGCSDVSECPKGDGGAEQLACCNHRCTDTLADGNNCGGCGTMCGTETCCAGFCSDISKDLSNCGMCGTACTGKHAMWSCAGLMCAVTTCTAGFGDCNGSSTDGCEATLATDVNNCSACGMKCAGANAVMACVANVCAVAMCNAGFANCDNQVGNGCEVNTNGDVNNCGGCNMKCALANTSQSCVNGKCAVGVCNAGFADCDGNPANGCEINTATDVNNCNGCNKVCAGVSNATVGCSGSKCAITGCTNGFKDCDAVEANGCESNPVTDVNNCGGCGTKCTAGANVTATTCSASACAVTACAANFADCDKVFANGCESNLLTDKNNCGGCGKPCANCNNGACQACVPTGQRAAFNTMSQNTSTACWLGSPCAQLTFSAAQANATMFNAYGQSITCSAGGPTCISNIAIDTYSSAPCQSRWDVSCDGVLLGSIITIGRTCGVNGAMADGCVLSFAPRLCTAIKFVTSNASGDNPSAGSCCSATQPDSMISGVAAW